MESSKGTLLLGSASGVGCLRDGRTSGLAPRGHGHSLILGEHCPREAVAGGAVDQPQRLLVFLVRVDVHGQHGTEDLLERSPRVRPRLDLCLRRLPPPTPPLIPFSAQQPGPGLASCRVLSRTAPTLPTPPSLAEDPETLTLCPPCQPDPPPEPRVQALGRGTLLSTGGQGTAP